VSAGRNFREALLRESPLQIVGAVNAYSALLAEQAGFRCLYLSGAGVANASFGLPDLGMTSRSEVTEEVRRIAGACTLPLLVDIDTGWGDGLSVDRTVREMERAGASAVHLEDQVSTKRCGHRPNKRLVSVEQMLGRLKAAVDGRRDADFFIMARTDAIALEGVEGALERAQRYVEAGADGIFVEAPLEGAAYRLFSTSMSVPILANMTEFGKTELYELTELAAWGIKMVLYPLSAFRSMNRAAELTYQAIRSDGHQRNRLKSMQTREELYNILHYHRYEEKLDSFYLNEDD